LGLEVALAIARQSDGRAAAEGLATALQRLWTVRDQLVEAGLEAGLLEDPSRYQAVREAVERLRAVGEESAAQELLAQAAWPPLDRELE
ncbi:MAG: hypothetical protein HUU35_20460, partial [Armatimonadetes bacterium]|nr:hypothetical protein [Armatimonadota bacterium]